MEYELVVTGDHNDADYVTEISTVDLETIQYLQPIFDAIKSFNEKTPYGHNWPNSEYANGTLSGTYPDVGDDLIDTLNEYVPHAENGIHSIVSIVYYPLPDRTVVFTKR